VVKTAVLAVDDLRSIPLFAGLDDAQLGELVDAGLEVQVEPGVELFREGEHADFWWVLVDGAIHLLRHVGREETVVGSMDVPGRWAGGFRAWDEQGVYLATGRGARAGRVLRVPAEALHELFTAWFPFGVHLVAGLYGTARSIESTVRQRESLVTLGTLAAGLAHEINNPAAAATRAVTGLEETSKVLLSCLGRLAEHGISADQFQALDALRRELESSAGPDDVLAVSDREEELSDWLEDHEVERAWDLAAELAAAGADLSWCARLLDVLPEPSVPPALEWVASTVSLSALLGEVKESTRRVSELVAAVRSYSQMDRASHQRVDVTEGIESTLVMLGHKLENGIEVLRAYDGDLPLVDGYPGELNQVWTNLVDNAVDAMDGRGRLRVAASAHDGAVVVEIGDTGPGLAPEVAARAFEAFFTTKDVGKGTGLGLDIARRIVVERHGGSITLESRAGETVARVTLPLDRAPLGAVPDQAEAASAPGAVG
jgi:signal transduction histidine kinase